MAEKRNATWPDYFEEDDNVFLRNLSNACELDDAAILAMCEDSTGYEDDNGSNIDEKSQEDKHQFSFGMEGSTINISNSTDIHFGPKTVSTSPLLSTSTTPLLSSSSSIIPHGLSTASDECSDSLNSEKYVYSPIPCFKETARNPLNHLRSEHRHRNFSSGKHTAHFTEDISSSLIPRSSNQTAANTNISDQNSIGDNSSINPSESNMKLMINSVSGSINDIYSPNSLFPSKQKVVENPSHECQNVVHCRPQERFVNASLAQTPMSAAITNSSHVQMGTQIVYNYFITDNEQRSTHGSSGSVSDLPPNIVKGNDGSELKGFLAEFKEKLSNVYLKRTRSSPLPWHRGKQLIPMNEYYTEPQIFAIDKCGNRTSEIVDLLSVLDSGRETRFLLEGEAGMGKTFLATKLAEEWANGWKLQQFQILFFITLGDFKGSLQQYIRDELLPSYFKPDQFEKVWEYCKTHENEVLFVLDGYDELERSDKGEIQNLIRNKDFAGSKVIVTSRPNFLQDWEKKIVVSGFDQLQIMDFIEKYFKAIGNNTCGHSLRKIIEKDEKYWKLARRPLFCVLLCMLYITGEVDESLPERQSDVMLQIILCLIKWNRKNNGTPSIDFDSLPPEYEKPFCNFGKLCLNALRTEKSRFSQQEVYQVDGFETKLEQLGFLFNDNENHALGEKKFWKPIHQTFLEYLGAFYMSKHIRECKGCKDCKDYNSVFQRSHEVLKFCVGILNNKAYKVLDGQRFPFLWKLPAIKILQLLKEAESKPDNCQAIAKLLDQNIVEITTSEVELEGWSIILTQSYKNLTTLRIAWRIKSNSPDQESSFIEATEPQYQKFFEALKNNESVRCIHVRAKQDGEPFNDEKMGMFFRHLQNALSKKNLQELHIIEMKMNASSFLKSAIENIANQSTKARALQDLKVLRLHTFMADKDLKGICDSLRLCAPSLESLQFGGLEHGFSGFRSLVDLLKSNVNIKNLHISMNQSLFVNVFGSCEEASQDYPPDKMRGDHQRMHRTAGRKSKHAFSEHENFVAMGENCSEEEALLNENTEQAETAKRNRKITHTADSSPKSDPRKELSFLFDKIPLNTNQWAIEARHFWYLRKSSSDLRIPLPLCVHREHKSVFHFLFSELPKSHIKSLTLSQAGLYLSISDMMCLGDAIRSATHLTSLNLQGLDKTECYLPLLIGLGQAPALATINFSSSKVILRDSTFEVACAALENNTSLKNVSIRSWQFHLQDPKRALKLWCRVLCSWQVVQLDLKQCLIDFGISTGSVVLPQSPTSPCSEPLNAFFSLPFDNCVAPWKSIKTLSLEGVELKEESSLVRRGHLLLSGLTNFVNLVSLDLSISQSRSIQVDDISLRRFFGLVSSEMKQLVELKLDNWEFNLDFEENDLPSRLHSCKKLKKVQLERVNERVPKFCLSKSESFSTWCKLTFLHHLVAHTPNLEEVSLCYYKINNSSFDLDMAAGISQCLHDHWHHMPFIVKFFNLSVEIDNIMYQTLKKPPCRVKRVVGPSLIRVYEVRSVLNIIKRH